MLEVCHPVQLDVFLSVYSGVFFRIYLVVSMGVLLRILVSVLEAQKDGYSQAGRDGVIECNCE
jgi:hypothetical protein